MLKQIIRAAVISALGAKLAKGRSPLVAALVTLLATRMLSGRAEPDPSSGAVPSSQSGLQELIEKFRQGGFEDIIKSWIGTGTNRNVTPAQLHQALGSDTVEELSRQAEMPKDDLLSSLSRVLPDIIDKLTPNGQLPSTKELVASPEDHPPH
jgi:uncharacterized protein YidB (DUF937 family)